MNEARIRELVEENIPASCISAKKLAAIRTGQLITRRRGDKVFATFVIDGFRLTAVV